MAESNVTRLLPAPIAEVPLAGLYLASRLHERRAADRVFVYTNFISSLDGRISVGGDDGGRPAGVPDWLANPRDWRLYQELAVQADVIITSGRYLRDFAAGRVGSIFTFDDDTEMEDLAVWRKGAGLARLPAVAVISRGLTFDPDAARRLGRDVIAIGAANVDTNRVRELEADAITVVQGVLYVTQVTRLLGGRTYATLDEGELLDPPPTMEAVSVYLDPAGAGGAAQLFAAFELRP
jgi:hypothetical protein